MVREPLKPSSLGYLIFPLKRFMVPILFNSQKRFPISIFNVFCKPIL